jgi:hypothetical protein
MIREILDQFPLPQFAVADRDALAQNLLFMHAVIVASEPLLEAALDQKPLPETVRNYYADHLEEERNHADWLLEDLQSIDKKPVLIDWRAARLVGAQYYLIHHVSPVALLGYIAVLECRPPPMEQIEQLEALHGEKLLRTARYHATHDIEHGKALLDLIDGMDDQSRRLIVANVIHTAAHIQRALEETHGAF